MDKLEQVLRDALAIYPEQVVRRNKVTPEAVPFVKHLARTSMISGMAAVASLLAGQDGSNVLTAQGVMSVIDKLAREAGLKCETVAL